MSCSKHDKVMFNIINSLEKTKFKFSWWKANNVSVTFTNTSLKCAIQIELNSIVERAERISGLETENQNSHFQTLRKKVMRHMSMLRSIGAQIEKTTNRRAEIYLACLSTTRLSANVSRPRKRQQNSKSCMWCHETMWCHVMLSCRDSVMSCWRRREKEQRHWRRRKEEQRYCDIVMLHVISCRDNVKSWDNVMSCQNKGSWKTTT